MLRRQRHANKKPIGSQLKSTHVSAGVAQERIGPRFDADDADVVA